MSCVLIYICIFDITWLIKKFAELVSKGTTGGTRRVNVCGRGEFANGCDIEG